MTSLPGLEAVGSAIDAQAPCGALIEAAARLSIKFVSTSAEEGCEEGFGGAWEVKAAFRVRRGGRQVF